MRFDLQTNNVNIWEVEPQQSYALQVMLSQGKSGLPLKSWKRVFKITTAAKTMIIPTTALVIVFLAELTFSVEPPAIIRFIEPQTIIAIPIGIEI